MSIEALRVPVAEDHDFQRRAVVSIPKTLGIQQVYEAAEGRAERYNTQPQRGVHMSIETLRVLVAEDHDFQRRTVVRILKTLGIQQVYEAAEGSAALTILRDGQSSVDVVVSDLDMPGMDGMEFMRHIGEADVPVSVILSSAHAPELISSVESMTREYGITLLGAIEKPVTSDKLRVLLEAFRAPKSRTTRAASAGMPIAEIQLGLSERQFEPYLQPKVSLHNGSVVGAEALARWDRPGIGIVAPYAFIGLMEEHGLIDELTWQILEKGVAICREWVRSGMDLSISFNLSLKTLSEWGVAEKITEIVTTQGLDPRHVIMEITETAAMTNLAKALENLARLRMKGFALSIDDYGTGYSSMQQLSRIPFSELKIDQSFVVAALKKNMHKVILESSLEMARRLKLQSVAEGVETRSHWNLLQSLGCDIAQGYFIAKPMEGAAFCDWVLEWRPPEL